MHAAPIAALCAELGYPGTVDEIAGRIEAIRASDADFLGVAVLEDGRIAGWIQAHASHVLESGFRVEIMGMIVAADCRRLGVGRELVQAAEGWGRERGAPRIVVRSNVARAESHAFYAALGYIENKTQRVYRRGLQGER